jgi:hypothetical protein
LLTEVWEHSIFSFNKTKRELFDNSLNKISIKIIVFG